MGNSDWVKAIKAITVNGIAYESGYVNGNAKYSLAATDGIITLGKKEIISGGENIIEVSAEGYQNLTIVMNPDGTVSVKIG